MLTSRTVCGEPAIDLALGGLSLHIEHHLFPTMPRPNLRGAHPIAGHYCARDDIRYEETGCSVPTARPSSTRSRWHSSPGNAIADATRGVTSAIMRRWDRRPTQVKMLTPPGPTSSPTTMSRTPKST